MPRRAHGRPVGLTGPARPAKRKPAKGRGLNALQIAEEQNPETYKIRQHRLGESYEDDDDSNTRQDADERSSKRRKVSDDQDGEQSDSGSDPDGERWHVGVDEDDEDSDIDSEDAFGESDEDRFADFTFRGSAQGKEKSRSKKRKAADEEEEEFDDPDAVGDIADDFGDDGIDLAAALDMDSQDESEEEQDKAGRRKRKQKQQPVADESNSDDDASNDEHDDDEDSDDEEVESSDEDGVSDGSSAPSDLFESDAEDGDHARLQNFVENLSRKSEKSKVKDPATQARTKVSAADLLQYVKDPQQRQSLKVLQNSEEKGPEVYKGGVPGRLAAPLAKRQQDKLDRAAAYVESKKELDKWVDTVKQNRRAEHISFPLVDPSDAPSRNDRFMPVSSSKPMNDLEAKIQDIMRESGMLNASAEKDEQEYEELAEQKLSPEEVQARRAELRRARDLMFREEVRAKRIKKIKSKAYRRVHRRERDKAALEKRAELAANGIIDSDDEKEKNDRRRAEERMGSRHRESKWARGAKAAGRTVWDDDARVGVSHMARRDDELRKRIAGKAHDESEGSGSESDAYSSDEAEEDIQRRMRAVDGAGTAQSSSRLANLDFMKRAEARQKVANDSELDALRRQMQNGDEELGDDPEELAATSEGGRQRFGQSAPVEVKQPIKKKPQREEFEERLSDEDDDEAEFTAVPSSATKTLKEIEPAKKSSSVVQSVRPVTKAEFQQSISRQSDSRKDGKASQRKSQQLADHLDDSDEDELAAGVFEGPDDVVQEFEREKEEVVKEEGDQTVDNSLPGWGSWGGAGISKKAQQKSKGRFITKIKGVGPEARKDAKLDRVIINEKRIKKNGKYLATELPHPYESRSQYERAMRLPLGPEWTTKSTFQDATKPRVLVKQGIIKPMSRPMV